MSVDQDKCTGCRACLKVACMALGLTATGEKQKVRVDPNVLQRFAESVSRHVNSMRCTRLREKTMQIFNIVIAGVGGQGVSNGLQGSRRKCSG